MRLINVRGIGPKSALNILGVISGQEMIQAIENDDIKRLKSLPGIGAKTAGQIVLDLKGKFVPVETKAEEKVENPAWQETQEALETMGFKASQLTEVKKELASQKDLTTSQMLRKALRLLGN